MKSWLKYFPLLILVSYLIFVGVRYFTNDRHVGAYTFNPFTNKLDYSQTVTTPVSDIITTTTYGVPVITASSSSYGIWGRAGVFSSSTLVVDGTATFNSSFLVKGALNASSTLNVTGTSTFYSSIFATGTIGAVPASGAGTRFMYIPSKGGAVRFGTVLDGVWDTSNIGYNSFAYGEGSKASGADSSGLGYYAVATGARSLAIGDGCTVNAADAVCIGQNGYVDVAATGGVVVGSASSNFGLHASAFGYLNIVEGTGGISMGYGMYNIGKYSTAIGLNSLYAPASKTANLDNTFVVVGGNSTFGSNSYNAAVVNVSATSTSGDVLHLVGIASQTSNYINILNSSSTSLFKVSTTTFGFNSGFQVKRTYVNATAYTAALTDYYLSASSTSQAVTVTLPSAAAACGVGSQIYVVKDKNGSAGTNNITVARSGSDTIDGATTKVINSAYGSFSFTSDCSANWEVN